METTQRRRPAANAPGEPVAERHWCDDTTVEALAALLLKQPRGLLLVRDELGGWISGFDRYAQGKGGDVAKWLEIFGGRPLLVDRKTSGQIYVPRASVSTTGGIQPGTLRRVLGLQHRENGLAARILMAWPPRKAKRWTEAEIAPRWEESLAEVFDRLYSLQPATDDGGTPGPVALRLTSEARRAWQAFYNEHAEEQVGLSGDLSAAWSKLEGYAARLALVVHCVRCAAGDIKADDPQDIDEGSVAAGVELSRWFGNEAKRIYAMLDESEEDSRQREVIELIWRKGGMATARDLMRSSRAFKTAGDAEAALNALVDAGVGQWETVSATAKGGRPTRSLRLVDSDDVDTTYDNTGEQAGCVNVDSASGPKMACREGPEADSKERGSA